MSQLSERTKKLLAELRHPASKLSDPLDRRQIDRRRELIAHVGASKETAAAAHLSPLLLDASLRMEVMAAIRLLLEGAPYRDLLWLHEVRGAVSGYDYARHPNWRQASPRDVSGDLDVWSLGMMSFHPSGYVREAAVESLKRMTDSPSLAFLLVRANDWAVPVRVSASQAVSQRISAGFAEQFAVWWPLVVRLAQSTRGDHSQLVESIRALLLSHWDALRVGLTSQDHTTRRASYELAFTGAYPKWVLDGALTDPDLMVRRLGAWVVARSHRSDRFDYLQRLSTDRLALVRRIAIDTLGREKGVAAKEVLLQGALDASASVRQRAQHYLRRRWKVNVPRFYRDACRGDAPAPSAVLGLAETGNAQDAERLEDFLSDGSARLRHAAIRGLVAVTPGTHVDAFYAALDDASAKVSHAARDAILTSSAPLRIAHLEALAKKEGSVHSRKNALRVLAQTPGWDALAPLLRVLDGPDGVVQKFGLALLAPWLAPAFLAPTKSQASEIVSALKSLRAILPHKKRKYIESELGRWRRDSTRGGRVS